MYLQLLLSTKPSAFLCLQVSVVGDCATCHWLVRCCADQQKTAVWFRSDKLRLVCSVALSPTGESGGVSLRETTVSRACDEGCEET